MCCCKHGLLEELCARQPKVPLKQNEKMRIPIGEHQRAEWGETGKGEVRQRCSSLKVSPGREGTEFSPVMTSLEKRPDQPVPCDCGYRCCFMPNSLLSGHRWIKPLSSSCLEHTQGVLMSMELREEAAIRTAASRKQTPTNAVRMKGKEP